MMPSPVNNPDAPREHVLRNELRIKQDRQAGQIPGHFVRPGDSKHGVAEPPTTA